MVDNNHVSFQSELFAQTKQNLEQHCHDGVTNSSVPFLRIFPIHIFSKLHITTHVCVCVCVLP
jgi:hypothetical protein